MNLENTPKVITALTMVFSLRAPYILSYLCTVHCKNGSKQLLLRKILSKQDAEKICVIDCTHGGKSPLKLAVKSVTAVLSRLFYPNELLLKMSIAQ